MTLSRDDGRIDDAAHSTVLPTVLPSQHCHHPMQFGSTEGGGVEVFLGVLGGVGNVQRSIVHGSRTKPTWWNTAVLVWFMAVSVVVDNVIWFQRRWDNKGDGDIGWTKSLFLVSVQAFVTPDGTCRSNMDKRTARGTVGTIRQPPCRRLLFTRKRKCSRLHAVSLLDRSGGLIYRTGVFQPDEFNVIVNEVMALTRSSSLQKETKSSVAQNRLGLALSPRSSPTVRLLQDPNNSLSKLVQTVATATTSTTRTITAEEKEEEMERYELAWHVPVEVRSYEKPGAGMAWHVDDVWYDPPQIEVVVTVWNTCNCQTVWKLVPCRNNDNHNHNNDKKHHTAMIYSMETDRNSALLLRAGVTPHCVTSFKDTVNVSFSSALTCNPERFISINHLYSGDPQLLPHCHNNLDVH